MDNFIINAILAGIGTALITGLLGCFVSWKKMAYFGDSLGHSAVLGVGIGMMLNLNYYFGIIFVILAFALFLTYLQSKEHLSNDSILGILAHGCLSFGIIMIGINNNPNFNLHAFLFGDLLLVNMGEIAVIFLIALVIYCLFIYNWKALILSTISRDLARSQNISNLKMDFLIILAMALTVAVSIQIIGALLITSMLIIPPATARQLVNNPRNMVIISIAFSILSLISGIIISYNFDIVCGPAIVACSFVMFFFIMILKSFIKR